MAQVNREVLDAAARKAHLFLHTTKEKDFLDELKIKFRLMRAYFDPIDGLPVIVLEIVTSKAARNAAGEMHTGALCVMFDHLSTSASFADPGWWDFTGEEPALKPEIQNRIQLQLGLSRNIEVHIQRPVIAGSTVYMVNKVTENSPTGTFFSSKLFDANGALLAVGHHDKVKLTKHVNAKL